LEEIKKTGRENLKKRGTGEAEKVPNDLAAK